MSKGLRVLLCASLAAVPALAVAGGVERGVAVSFDLLVGYPPGGSDAAPRTVVVPGFVIPLDAVDGEPAREEAAEHGAALARAIERLWATFRLDPGRRLQASQSARLENGRSLALPTPAGSGLSATVTLTASDAAAATFKAVIRRSERTLADTTVSVKRGSRAVVGGMDGAEAAYVFLILDVAAPGRERTPRAGSDGIAEPVIIRKVAPAYPPGAREARVSGIVILEAEIETDGRVGAVKVVQGADPRLDQAAVEAVRQWAYEPLRDAHGKPVKALSTVTIRFVLE